MISIVVLFTISDSLVNAKQKTKVEKLKKYVCTEICNKYRKCVIAHCEKGQVCGANCKKLV